MIVSLTGGTVGNTSGNAVDTSATSGTTTITSNVALTSTGGRGIDASSTTGNINIGGTGTITGGGTVGVNAASSSGGNIRIDGLTVNDSINASTSGTIGITAVSTTNAYIIPGYGQVGPPFPSVPTPAIIVVAPGGTISAISHIRCGCTSNGGTRFIDVINNVAINNPRGGAGVSTNAEAGPTRIFANANITGTTRRHPATSTTGNIRLRSHFEHDPEHDRRRAPSRPHRPAARS